MTTETTELQGVKDFWEGGSIADIKEVRMLSIGDYEKGADGGTHVKSTKEVGKIVFEKYASKGKDNKRIYFKLK